MECRDGVARQNLMQIFGYILRVPRISAETQDQVRPASRFPLRRNINPRQALPTPFERQFLGVRGHGPRLRHGMSRKDQAVLEVEHEWPGVGFAGRAMASERTRRRSPG